MNVKDKIIIEDYRKARDAFIKLDAIVYDKLCSLVKNAGIQTLGIEHRVKSEASLAEKLVRNGDWYQKFDDLTDILGARVICFFNDEVDKLGKEIEKHFTIDWNNSSDKRALIKADSFGYLSLHYTCYFSEESGYPKEVCNKKFEIQIRTVLQHTWAAIEHDIGYKSEFGLPREYARGFSRVAGLLEVADDEFIRLRDGMKAYTDDIRARIKENRADEVAINSVSINEFVLNTDATEAEILALGNEKILRSVKLLTKTRGYVMKDYVDGIKKDKTAFLVKGADRLHNLRSAVCADTEFKRRYIYETIDWYLDFMPEIPSAVKNLAKTLDVPLKDLPFLYEPIDNWKK